MYANNFGTLFLASNVEIGLIVGLVVGVVVALVVVDIVLEGHFQAVAHQIPSGELLAFEGQGRVVDAVQLGDGIGAVGVKAGHGYSR